MKTAMQQLIEYSENILKNSTINANLIIKKANELLELEKGQIIRAHKEGQADLLNPQIREMSELNRQKISETYYSKTFEK